jgi:predicted nucleic acid-binding protein
MPEAISNTSPLLYLHRTGVLEWLPRLFSEIWVPGAVVRELKEGQLRGYDVPDLKGCGWVQIIEPRSIAPEWFALDLGPGEIAVVSLALENPTLVVLLDDALARRIAQAAGLNIWGTLKVLLEAKSQGLTATIEPLIGRLKNAGMWISDDIERRILTLAKERMG